MSMNTLEMISIISVIILVLTLLPVFIRVEIYLNILSDVGVIALSVWGIRLRCIQLKLSKEVISVIKKNDKQIRLNLFDPHLIFMRYLLKSMFTIIILRYIRLYVDVGNTDNSFFASLIGGGIYAVLESVFAIIKTRKNSAELLFDVVPHSEENEGKICGCVSVVISPILMIYSLIRAKVLQKRWFRMYERYSA